MGTYVQASGVGVTLAERWNGSRWAIQRTPNPAGAKVSALQGVACTSSSACTAVGYSVAGSGVAAPLAERWNGSGWRLEPMPSPAGAQRAFPTAVACTSAASCTAVGYYATGPGAWRTLAERWNGTRWAIQPTPNPAGAQFPRLNDVSCTAASACTAVGQTLQGTLAVGRYPVD